MSYQVLYRLNCDWPDGCIAQFEGTYDEALDHGWVFCSEMELCPPHGIADVHATVTEAPEPPLPDGVTWLDPRPEFQFVPAPLAHEEDVPADTEDSVIADMPGTDRLAIALAAHEQDEGGTRGDGWLASNLRRWSRMAGRHASPDRRPARDRAALHGSQ